jgi:hypothetical protein
MKAHCMIRMQKAHEISDLMNELKTNKPSDPTIVKYLIQVYNELGTYSEATTLLEYALTMSLDNEELCEELFFAYVREGKLLK